LSSTSSEFATQPFGTVASQNVVEPPFAFSIQVAPYIVPSFSFPLKSSKISACSEKS
jgi:hypothetical protein